MFMFLGLEYGKRASPSFIKPRQDLNSLVLINIRSILNTKLDTI